MTEKNEKLINFYEFLTLHRDRKRREARVNRFSLNRLDFNRLSHSRKALQN